MFKAIKEFFVGKQQVDVVAPGAAPYELPEPVMVTETVIVSAPYKVEPPVHVTNTENPVDFPAPVVAEAPAKAPRKPRAPKATPVVAVKEKPPAKAKVPKLTVVKAVKSKKI